MDTSWGLVSLEQGRFSLTLEGTRTGAKAQRFTGKEFPTPIADLEQRAVDLGYRCERTTDAGFDERVCNGSTGNEMAITAFEDRGVITLSGGFVDIDGQSAFLALVLAAAPADAPALAAVLDEATATQTLAYRATSGFLVLCHRPDAVRCSVYGVGWE